MSDVIYKSLDVDALDQIGQIDRTEPVKALYEQSGEQLSLSPVEPFVGQWPSIPKVIEFCRDHMQNSAETLGAFDDDALVGIGIMTPNIQPQMAQLAFLHISAGHRRRGIATHLLSQLKQRVILSGHSSIYVTATPTKSAVGFYLRAGFLPTDQPIPHLLALEPEDIHMVAMI